MQSGRRRTKETLDRLSITALINSVVVSSNIQKGGQSMGVVGRAIAQVVSRWLPTAAARIRSRVLYSGICGGQSGAGASFLRVLRFPLPIVIPPNSPLSKTPGAGYNRPIRGRRAEWTQLDSNLH
jgi:hypothetical protein